MRSSKRALVVSYVVLLAVALAVGCSTKDDPSEVLELCGNHSCGQLAMVTIDTSKDGFQYLEVALSPDQAKVAFTADWAAIPSIEDYSASRSRTGRSSSSPSIPASGTRAA